MNASKVQLLFYLLSIYAKCLHYPLCPWDSISAGRTLKLMSTDFFLSSMTCELAARSVPSFFRFDIKGARPNERLLAISFVELCFTISRRPGHYIWWECGLNQKICRRLKDNRWYRPEVILPGISSFRLSSLHGTRRKRLAVYRRYFDKSSLFAVLREV